MTNKKPRSERESGDCENLCMCKGEGREQGKEEEVEPCREQGINKEKSHK